MSKTIRVERGELAFESRMYFMEKEIEKKKSKKERRMKRSF